MEAARAVTAAQSTSVVADWPQPRGQRALTLVPQLTGRLPLYREHHVVPIQTGRLSRTRRAPIFLAR